MTTNKTREERLVFALTEARDFIKELLDVEPSGLEDLLSAAGEDVEARCTAALDTD